MQLIHCTSKLQKEMGLKKADLCEVSPKFSYLGSWHANLLYIDRRKCVLFANDKTLFNFIAADVPRAQIRKLGELFKGMLTCALSEMPMGAIEYAFPIEGLRAMFDAPSKMMKFNMFTEAGS